jgi:hypothetical protein
MGKKIVAVLIVLCFLLVPFGCSGNGNSNLKFDFKVGIITGSETYCPEEYSVVNSLSSLYGSDSIVSAVNSDDFAVLPIMVKTVAEQMAADKSVKVMIFDRAVVGTAQAITEIKKTRSDLFIVCIASDEDASSISSLADLVINVNEIELGKAAVEQAKEMGAQIFIHYTYNRHLEYKEVVRRKDAIEKACEQAGIEFYNEPSVDPSSENGVDGAKQYIREDAVRKQKKFTGKKIAYFSTDSVIQDALIETSLQYKTILPVQVNPSPYVGFPEMLGIDMKGHESDIQYLLTQIKQKVQEKGNSGKMAIWSVSMPQVMLNSAFSYAIKHVKNEWGDKIKSEELIKIINETAGGENIVNTVKYVDAANKAYDNIFVVSGKTYKF